MRRLCSAVAIRLCSDPHYKDPCAGRSSHVHGRLSGLASEKEKVIDKTEEEEDGVITVREKERFSNELTLVYSTGEVAILKQSRQSHRSFPQVQFP